MEIRQAISMYLKAYVMENPEFKTKYENPDKNLDDCLLYIQAKMLEKVTEEQKKGGAAVVIPSDDEIFSLAVAYYTNEDLKIEGDKFNNVRVLSMAATTFTEEEKAKMREQAEKEYKEKHIAALKKKETAEKTKNKGTAKPKKATAPTIVPDVPAKTSDEPKKETKTEEKPKVVQLELDW